jgi:hypothetical protein
MVSLAAVEQSRRPKIGHSCPSCKKISKAILSRYPASSPQKPKRHVLVRYPVDTPFYSYHLERNVFMELTRLVNLRPAAALETFGFRAEAVPNIGRSRLAAPRS